MNFDKLLVRFLGFILMGPLFQSCIDHESEQCTFINPLNLNYRYQLEEPSRREAADPTVITFKGYYLLFSSKSGGYWYSDNLKNWEFVETSEIPTEEYAPTAIVIGDTVYFLASSSEKSTIYKSAAPLSGTWDVAKEELDTAVWDPAFFLDDDGRLYLYWGCSNQTPIYGVEIDYKNKFSFLDSPKELINSNHVMYGWERRGDYNTLNVRPYIEGAWLFKSEDTYHLQYSGPGTQFKCYADAFYKSDSPLGPFQLAKHNPFSYKPEGFIAGAGHGSTFMDEWGNYWYMGTMSVSVIHKFERRLGLFPVFSDSDSTFYAYTAYGDFPHVIPNKKMTGPEDYQPAGMLLSYKKAVEVSSFLPEHTKKNAVNEEVREYWSAKTGDKGEWIMVNLENNCEVQSIQINYFDEGTGIFGRPDSIYYQYLLESSVDGDNWEVLVDKSKNTDDCPHDYIELSQPVTARYIRLTNYRVPDGKFALSGLRIFGNGNGDLPSAVSSFSVERNPNDGCIATLNWEKSNDAIGYNIRYGVQRDKLYLNYQVFDTDSLTIRSLAKEQPYYFTIDAFNENGITVGSSLQVINTRQ